MVLTHQVAFALELGLARPDAVAFVRDASRSLACADFLSELRVDDEPGGPVVRAALPVNAAMFGARRLRFASRVERTPEGARLRGLPLDDRPGWAKVSGEARVTPQPGGSHVAYRFDIGIHLDLPAPDRWGGRALLKMVEVTASTVLSRVSERFPPAVREAARAFEATAA